MGTGHHCHELGYGWLPDFSRHFAFGPYRLRNSEASGLVLDPTARLRRRDDPARPPLWWHLSKTDTENSHRLRRADESDAHVYARNP